MKTKSRCGHCSGELPEEPSRVFGSELEFCDDLCLRLWYTKIPSEDRISFVRSTMEYHDKCVKHVKPETYVYGVLVGAHYVHVSYNKHPELVGTFKVLNSKIVILEETMSKMARRAVAKWRKELLR